jgi:hypothetical protein
LLLSPVQNPQGNPDEPTAGPSAYRPPPSALSSEYRPSRQSSWQDRNFNQKEREDMEYLNEQPLAPLFLALITENMILAEKLGVEQSHLTVDMVALAFRKMDLMEDLKRKLYKQESADEIKKDMLAQELQSFTINQEFPVPTEFSSKYKLTNSNLRKEAMFVFPPRQKFSGSSYKDGGSGMPVEEFLAAMTRGQKDANLHRDEFHEMLLICSTGRAHSLLVDWLGAGETTESIYHLLAINFDRRVSPDVAKSQLLAFKATKDMTLADVEARITQLSGRAVTTLPPGESRTNLKNLEGVQALIRALPATSSTTVSNAYSMISSKLGRPATYFELTRSLNIYRTTIDADIRANGVDAKKKDNTKPSAPRNGNNGQNGQKKQNSYGSYAMNATEGNPKDQNKGGDKKSEGEGNKKSENKNHNKGKSGGDKRFCTMCGRTGHTAAQGCRAMVSNEGRIVPCTPTQATCNACPASVQPRLNHPTDLCPYRVGGPWNKNTK